MIMNDQNNTNNTGNTVEQQYFPEKIPALVLRINVATEVSNKDQEKCREPECAFLQHKKAGEQCAHQCHINLAFNKIMLYGTYKGHCRVRFCLRYSLLYINQKIATILIFHV